MSSIKSKNEKCILFRTVSVIIAVLLFFSITITNAFAYNADYLDKVKWIGNSSISTESVNVENPFGTANGTVSYFGDANEYSFYVYLSVSENTITESAQQVSLDFDIFTDEEQYYFSIDSNGAMDYIGAEVDMFDVDSSFVTYPDTKSGDYIVAIDIDDNKDANYITVHLNVNGHRYLILENLLVERPIEETTTKVATTKQKTTKTKSIKKSKVKKSSDKNSNKSNKVSFDRDSVKVSPIEQTTQPVDTAIIEPTNNAKESLSTMSLIMLIVAIVIALIGLFFVLYALLSKKKKQENEAGDDPCEIDNFDF